MSINKKFTTVPNQKVIVVAKAVTDEKNKYARINLQAMDNAAQDLGAGAFKLWIYFAKNQNGYEFALSRQAVENNFGIKKKQYDNAIEELITKKYLVVTKSNYYTFYEVPKIEKESAEVPKSNQDVEPKSDCVVITKSNQAWYPKEERNTTNITNITNNITEVTELESSDVTEPCEQAHPSPAARSEQAQNLLKQEEKVNYPTIESNMLPRIVNGYEVIGDNLVRLNENKKIFKVIA